MYNIVIVLVIAIKVRWNIISLFSKYIKKIRLYNNLTQKEFAETLGVTSDYISKIESDRRKPSQYFIIKLSNLFNLDKSYVVSLLKLRKNSDAIFVKEHCEIFTVAIAIVKKDDKVLMVKRKQREGNLHWQFPAGIVKPSQKNNIEDRLLDEVKGETNISCKVLSLIGERVHPDTQTLCIYYYCEYLHGETLNLDKDENSDVSWVKIIDVDNYISSNLFSPVRTLLQSFIFEEEY